MTKSAFPVQGMSLKNGQQFQAVYDDGMTLRDYFAAKAMQSLVAGETWPSCSDRQLAADIAYKMADAMMEARK